MPIRIPPFCRNLTGSIPLAAAILLLAGCASSPYPRARAFFPSATINHQAAHLALDTGAEMSSLFESGADRLDVPAAFSPPDIRVNGQNSFDTVALSPPLDFAIGNQTFSAPISIISFPWYESWGVDWLGSDGVIGWPQVRDNILVFDGATRTIRAVSTLPPETATWLKLRILPAAQLRLEIPAGDGTTGNLLVDTGSPEGISLPPVAWNYWRNQHLQDRAVTRNYSMPGLKAVSASEVWADEISLGPLTLTDVPVHPAQSVEDANLSGYVGTLGLYALSRLDFIVDASHGFAYLHPKPPPGPPYPGFPRPSDPDPAKSLPTDSTWTIADSVQLKIDPLFFYAGYVKYRAGDFPGALAEFNSAIQLDPQNLSARVGRAEVATILGHYEEAIADYSVVIARDPRSAEAHYQRGVTRQLLGDDVGAIADYSRAILLQPDDSALPRLNRYLLDRELGHADPNFAESLVGWPDGWTKIVAKFLLGQVSEAGLFAIAAQPETTTATGQAPDPATKDQHLAMAYYFAGMIHHLDHDDPAARALWQKSLHLDLAPFNEYQAFSRAQLSRLDPANPK